jgi:hypothetical protein
MNPDPDPRNKYIISNLSKRKRRHEHGCTSVDKKGGYSEYDSMNNYKDYKLLTDKEMIGFEKRYGEDLLPKYSCASDMDNFNKLVIPNIASKSKRDSNTSNYMFDIYYDKLNQMDHSIEDDLLRGMPSYRPRNRSYGYRQPAENYFDYIDDDFQNSDNCVEFWQRGGTPTRLDNKFATKNRNYQREVM